MATYPRADKTLNDAINHLEQKLIDCDFDERKAWDSLGQNEMGFVIQETVKCRNSLEYYLQNYHFIRRKDTSIATIYPLWESQSVFIEVFWKQYNENRPIRIMILKSRQQGITTLSVAILCWMTFLSPNRHVLSMSDEYDKVSANYNMARMAYHFLPWWMRPGKRYDRESELLGFDRNKGEDTKGLDSRIMFEAANKPSGAAYSKSLFAAHLAEIGRYRHPKPITEGVFGSLIGLPRSLGILEGTAQGRGTLYHGLWKQAIAGQFAWEPIFIEWFKEPSYRTTPKPGFALTANENALKAKIKETIGYEIEDEQFQWYRDKRQEFIAAGDEARFPQEFPSDQNEAWVASGDTIFPKTKLLDQLTHFVRKPRWRGIITLEEAQYKLIPDPEGDLSVWEFAKAGGRYVIGADTSLGLESGDLSAAHVIAVPNNPNEPLRQCAVLHGRIPPHEFSRCLAALGYMYNAALIAPEVNQINSIVVDLVNTFNYPNVYRMTNTVTGRGMAQYLGWMTTYRNKNAMIGRLRELLLKWDVVIKDDKTINEMLEFVQKDNVTGQYGPQSHDGHDDLVMALCITAYVASDMNPEMLNMQDNNGQLEVKDYQAYDVEESDSQASDYVPAFEEL